VDQLGVYAERFFTDWHLQLLSASQARESILSAIKLTRKKREMNTDDHPIFCGFRPSVLPVNSSVLHKKAPRQKNLRERLKTSSGSLAVFNVEQVTYKSPRLLGQKRPVSLGQSLSYVDSEVNTNIFMEQ
jgi:hypothetical protein